MINVFLNRIFRAIKIDIEGYEHEAIQGGINTIKKYEPILMIEVNEKTLNHIETDKRDFGPELEELKQTEIKDINFHLKYYRSLVNYINSIPESKMIKNQ